MTKKKIKRKPKKALIILIIATLLIILGIILYFVLPKKETVEEAKVISNISEYGYKLHSNKSKEYHKLFDELKKTLTGKVKEKKYVELITKMFIVDFYSLENHSAKTDVGGTDFVHKEALENFILNAEDTYYKYLESNIYKQRKQKLPVVDEITIDSIENVEYSYLEEIDEKAYQVKAHWNYKDNESFSDYQNKAILTFVHDGKKLVLVELEEESQDE